MVANGGDAGCAVGPAAGAPTRTVALSLNAGEPSDDARPSTGLSFTICTAGATPPEAASASSLARSPLSWSSSSSSQSSSWMVVDDVVVGA